jgi:WXG100 family type VII secretion target
MSTIGAEMGQLEGLKNKFSTEGQNVATLRSSIGSQVQSTWWKGPAADSFRAAWDGEFSPMLAKLEQALQEASQEIGRRHEALLQAGS